MGDQVTLDVIHLIGAVAIGGFIGEFNRSVVNESIIGRVFMSNLLSGCFLSFCIVYLLNFFIHIGKKEVFYVLGAILAYQDEGYIKDTARKIINTLVNNIDKGGDGGDKK